MLWSNSKILRLFLITIRGTWSSWAFVWEVWKWLRKIAFHKYLWQ